MVPAVLADARIGNDAGGKIGKTEGVVQLPVQEQSAVRADRRTAERQLHRAVKMEPKRPRFLFTHRVYCQGPAPSSLSRCYHEDITGRWRLEARSIWDMRGHEAAAG